MDAAHLLWTATAMSNRSPRVSSKPGTSRPGMTHHKSLSLYSSFCTPKMMPQQTRRIVDEILTESREWLLAMRSVSEHFPTWHSHLQTNGSYELNVALIRA